LTIDSANQGNSQSISQALVTISIGQDFEAFDPTVGVSLF